MSATVAVEPWGSGDLPLLERLIGAPRRTEHLGAPETPESSASVRPATSTSRAAIACSRSSKWRAGAGSVGFWTKEWRDGQVNEVGWMVVP